MTRLVTRRLATLFLVATPLVARADIGLPMVAVFLPPMWLALIPIILIEALLLKRLLPIKFARALLPTSLGNVASTLVGVPLTWLALAILELICCGSAKGLATVGSRLYAVTIQAPWLIPYEDEFYWMIPVALGVLAIPCFAVSVLIEAPINRFFLQELGHRDIWRATAISNAGSYAVIGLLIWPAQKLGNHMPGLFSPLMEWFVETTFSIVKAVVGK
jgi:hypothetical protein